MIPENHASRRMLAKVGYRPHAKVGYLRLGPWVHHFERPDNRATW